MIRWTAAAACALLALAGCLEFSPHELPRDESERDLNRKAIARILAIPPGPLRFAVVGDTQRGFDEAKDAVESIDGRDVQFVVQVGDFSHVGTLFEYREMNEIFSRLRVPHLVVVGNHDHFSNGEAIYGAMFGPTDFAFTRGRVKLVFFDSNSVSHGFDGTVPDVAGVAAMLAPSPEHDRAITFAHIAPGGGPLFDDRLTAPLRTVLGAAGVPVSFHGHAHRFDDFVVDGVRYVIADSVEHRSYVIVTEGPGGAFEIEKVDF